MRTPIIYSLLVLFAQPLLGEQLLLQDGRKLNDAIVSISEGVVKLKRGKPVPLALCRTITLARTAPGKDRTAIHLGGTDVVYGKIGRQHDRRLTIRSPLLGDLRVRLQDIRLIDFGGQGKIPDEVAGAEDYLYAHNKEGTITRLKGALERISPEAVSFVWKRSGKTYTIPLEKLRALRLGRTEPEEAIEGLSIRLTLTDGSMLTGEGLALAGAQADLHHTSDRVIRCPRKAIARIRVSSDWIVYLANQAPTSTATDRLYDADRLLPAYRKNRSIWGGSLAPYTSGIGTYGTTLLTYDIRSRYRTFEAAIWVGTPEKVAGITALRPQGEVIFRIHGDGKKLYDSGLIRAGDKPRQIKVHVANVRTLTLEVNRGPGWGVGDAANWGNPRVHK